MSHPIDVGSVLGGRYKVTATVLSSHDQDLVLDGVDQVLNRPVSILVAGPHNADQVAQSAREVATGERPGNVQILDLGVSDSTTYLITNHTTAVDLLDLVVASNPPYVEPFFTDTLGSEIFGQARSLEPEIYDDEEEVDAGYISYADAHPRQADSYPASTQGRNSGEHSSRPSAPQQPAGANSPGVPGRQAPIVPPLPPGRPGSVPPGAGAAAGAAAGGAAAARSRQQTEAPETTAPQPVQRENVEQALLQREGNRSANPSAGSHESAAAGAGGGDDQPRVSLWSQDDYDYPAADQYADDENTEHDNSGHPDRRAGNFPAVARTTSPAAAADYDDEDHTQSEPRSMRWLVGGLLAAVLIVGLIFAVTNLGSLFKTTPQAQPTPPASSAAPQTATPSPTQSTAPAVGPPAVESVTRQGSFDFASTYDNDLSKTFDGNAASYWSDMEFATDNWGGLAPDGVPLVVKLKDPSKVSSITLNQLGGSGGSISVFTNDRPSMDGAKQVGTNSFTSPDLTMPLAEPVTAEYVIVSIKNLPRLAAPKTRYGFGLRLAEIRIQ